MARAVTVLGYIAFGVGAALMLLSIVDAWRTAGFGSMLDLLSPFNFYQWALTAVAVAPGLFLIWLGGKLAAYERS